MNNSFAALFLAFSALVIPLLSGIPIYMLSDLCDWDLTTREKVKFALSLATINVIVTIFLGAPLPFAYALSILEIILALVTSIVLSSTSVTYREFIRYSIGILSIIVLVSVVGYYVEIPAELITGRHK